MMEGDTYTPTGKVEETLPYNFFLQKLLDRYVEKYTDFFDSFNDADGHIRRQHFRELVFRARQFINRARMINQQAGGLLERRLEALREGMKESSDILTIVDLLDKAVVVCEEFLYSQNMLIATRTKPTVPSDLVDMEVESE